MPLQDTADRMPRVDCPLSCFKLIALAIGLVAFHSNLAFPSHEPEDSQFEQKVQPIFVAKCYPCHGPKLQKSSYRLDVREIAIRGGDNGEAAIIPGNGRSSPLVQYVSDPNSEMAMPPKDSQIPGLSENEIAIVSKWIDDGAKWPDSANVAISDPLDWWSFKPLATANPPNSTANAIDGFIVAKLTANGLAMSPEVDAQTLGRRLYFDLIGLPPEPEVLDDFERAYTHDSEAALDSLVEKLLAMPQYGERWARHWLDIVHYGDTHGYDKDKPRPNAWPYRDYVIRSLNEDKPYARFVEEQIAGDVLWPGTRDGIEAMGFIAAGPWDFIGHAEVPESKTDGKIARHLDRDDMVANTMGTFCSVTVHCAQCHQHKFDPITQEDYYRLHAVFAALDRTDRKYYSDDAVQQKFLELDRKRVSIADELKSVEDPLKKQAGEEYLSLTKQIEKASKEPNKNASQGDELGYHSNIEPSQDKTKWVQVDLGMPCEVAQIKLFPCYDDFNGIGAGFGFPVRFKVEASDDPEFRDKAYAIGDNPSETLEKDFKNPGLATVQLIAKKDTPVVARFVRVTATKLAPRQNDFIFAIAELQVIDQEGTCISSGKMVSALDSIEAGPRWRMSNLTDGKYPIAATVDKASLISKRETLLLKSADRLTVEKREQLIAKLELVDSELKKLPAAKMVYAGGIHHGSGTFVGTGPMGGKPRSIHLLVRGQVTQPAAEVGPGTLKALKFRSSDFEVGTNGTEGDRRIALAHWITDPKNPLTWRSIVNRVWQFHFGHGIVDTSNDFGRNGSLPSHPELLDWMASEFRDQGGSLKKLHRLIVKSATYRQASTHNDKAMLVDSNNTLLWRQNRRRLEAEAIRDSILAVSGQLDRSMGGPGWQDFVIEHPEHSPHYEYALADPEDTKTWRRSIYRFIVRSQTQPWMTSLDCADPSMRVDKRNESLSAIQSLALLNNGFVLTQSKYFADRLQRESADLNAQVERAYRLALGVNVPNDQRTELSEFAKANGLPYLCRLLFNLNAFTFVD